MRQTLALERPARKTATVVVLVPTWGKIAIGEPGLITMEFLAS